MKQMKPILVIAGVVAAAAVFFTSAAPVRGQGRDRGWIRQFPVLEGPGSRIGVTARELEAAELEQLKVAGGVFLETVTPDSPGARAGLRAQDVVVEFDGERVRSLRQFTRLVRETPPGRPVRAAVMRDGKRTELTVTPAAGGHAEVGIDVDRVRRQIEDFSTRLPFEFPDRAARSRLGVIVQELTPELAAYFGAADGVLVSSVVADSPASRSGIKAGDVLTTVDGRGIASAGDLVRELRTASTDGEVTVGIVRDKKATTVFAKVETPAERRPSRQARPIRSPV